MKARSSLRRTVSKRYDQSAQAQAANEKGRIARPRFVSRLFIRLG